MTKKENIMTMGAAQLPVSHVYGLLEPSSGLKDDRVKRVYIYAVPT